MESLIGPFVFCYILLDVVVICAAWVYSRFVFNGHLKKHHRSKWDELVVSTDDFKGPNLFAFDITRSMSEFRVKSAEDLGDPLLAQIRCRSLLLFKVGIWAWMVLALSFLIVGGVHALATHH